MCSFKPLCVTPPKINYALSYICIYIYMHEK